MKRLMRFRLGIVLGLCLSLLGACTGILPGPTIDSFTSAHTYLNNTLLSGIQVDSQLVTDTEAYNVVVPNLADPVPDPKTFPLYGAQPTADPNIIYLEIYSSAEKANGERQDERWLVDVAERFNQQRQRLPSGQIIQVGIRNIPSGLGAQILAAGQGKPAGYTPATALWLQLLKAQGVSMQAIAPNLANNQAIFAMQPQVYESLVKGGEVTFDRFMDAVLAGQVQVGYSNPYIASSALNFLYTLLWKSSGNAQANRPLSIAELKNPQVNSAFAIFQKQIVMTTPTYLDLKQIWLRNPNQFQAIIMAYQSYTNLKKQPGFEQLAYVPFGVPEASPLVSFDWTSVAEKQALTMFADFATSAPMQQLAVQQGYEQTDYLKQGQFPPLPDGAVLQAAQSFWKQRKDGGQTVYLEMVVDTSGSMEASQRLQAVKQALKVAMKQINPGNQVGLVSFSDRPVYHLHLAPFNTLEAKRFFAAVDRLKADGATALYDGLAVGLKELMDKQKSDPNGRFYLLLLTDGARTSGLEFGDLKAVLQHSNVRVYPIAYGEVNSEELEAIAAIREGVVYTGTPEKVQVLMRDLFQTNL